MIQWFICISEIIDVGDDDDDDDDGDGDGDGD